MSYVTSRRTRLQQQLTLVQAMLATLYANLTELSASSVSSYDFESGEGRQRASRRSLKDVQDQIERLEATEEHLINELSNMGLISVALRRKPGCM